MNIQIDTGRIVALEIRRSCIGYAVLQGPRQLLDWGTTSPSPLSNAPERARNRVLFILKLLAPAAVVVRKSRADASQSVILRIVRAEVSRRSIPIVILRQDQIRQALNIIRSGNKDETAELLTRIFPELLFKLPRKRRAWQSEPHAMLAFDAVAVGLAFWLRQGSDGSETQ